jgi:hypothetical protein
MSMLAHAATAGHPYPAEPVARRHIPSRGGRILIRLVLLIVCGLTVCIGALILIARVGSIATPSGPPLSLLPGQPLPTTAQASEWTEETYTYSVQANGRLLDLTYDPRSRSIVQTVLAAHDYTIGALILAWGTPSSFDQAGRAVNVYWGARSAYLITCSLRPDSPVEFIAYSAELHQAKAWHGVTSARYGCSGS